MEAPARPDATAPVPEEQLAALREEIRRAGAAIPDEWQQFCVKVGMCGGVAFATGTLLCKLVPVLSPWSGYIIGGAGMGVAFQYLLRRWRRKHVELAEQLRQYPTAQVCGVLGELARHPNDHVQGLAEEMARHLNLPTELTPAGMPEGSGAEVSGG